MIRTVGLGRRFGDLWAVRDLNLHVGPGEIYGFLGPNGAGKTTAILMLLGILKPTTGQIRLFGREEDGFRLEDRRRIGVVSEKPYLYPEMAVGEYLDFFAELYRVPDRRRRIEDLAEKVALTDLLRRRLGACSRGMQQKVGMVRALLHDPELLILDEPVSGLDPLGILQVRRLLEEEHRKGKTTLISSHLLSEVERLCDRVGIMNHGHLLAEDRTEDIIRKLSPGIELEVELPGEAPEGLDALLGLEFVLGLAREDRLLRIQVKADRDHRQEVIRWLMAQEQVPVGIQVRSMTLEEAFLAITEENISLLAKADPHAAAAAAATQP